MDHPPLYNVKKEYPLTLSALALVLPSQAAAIYSDNFDDNINTGWTYHDRSGGTAIVTATGGSGTSPSFAEQNGQLEQTVTNYTFPNGTGGPQLGGIALSGSGIIGGTYTISVALDSLEAGNNFQDQVVVFGYVDEDNFSYIETIPDRVDFHQVVAGVRTQLGVNNSVTFSHDPTNVDVLVDTVAGDVSVNFGGAGLVSLATGQTLSPGLNGVGSNNDAFAIDDFSITSITPAAPTTLEITSVVRDSTTGEATITWTSQAGVDYFVDRSTDLINWLEVDDAVGEAGTTSLIDSTSPEAGAFYQIRTE